MVCNVLLGGLTVGIVELERSIKYIFVQCINDPEILKIMKEKLSDLDKLQNNQMDQTKEREDIKIYNNKCVMSEEVIKKIDVLLDKQKEIEEYIRNSSSKKNEDLTDKLEQEKEKHAVEIEELKKKLGEEIENYKGLLETFQKKNLLLQEDNKNLLSTNKSMEERTEELKSRYSICEEMLDIWNCVNSLNYDNRNYIEKLCGGTDILAIVSLGRDENKIGQLWSYLRDLAVRYNDEKEISIMNRYFEFCIKVCNSTKLDSEKYVIADVEVGSEFDANQSIKTSNSKQIGNVKAVVVKGVLIGDHIKFQPIVRVE